MSAIGIWWKHRRWYFAWLWHRCSCCSARNMSVEYWSWKGPSWLCGECAYGMCDFDCDGIPWRKAHPNE